MQSFVERSFQCNVVSKSVPTGPRTYSVEFDARGDDRVSLAGFNDPTFAQIGFTQSRKEKTRRRKAGSFSLRSLRPPSRLCVKPLLAIKIDGNEVCFTRGAFACLGFGRHQSAV